MKTAHVFPVSLLLIAILFCPALNAQVITGHQAKEWADEASAAIETIFGRSDGLYTNSVSDRWPAYVWGQGIMLSVNVQAASVDLTYLDRARKQADEMRDQYWCTQNGYSGYNAGSNACGDRYYDDNAWIALALIELYNVCGDEKYLNWSRDTIAFSMSGENGPENSPDGGIRWHESNTGGASICATAPTSLTNLMIYEATGIESYLYDGWRLYYWMITNDDYRLSNGIFHETNQGPLGYQTAVVTQCAVSLYRITGEAHYLEEAQLMAAAMEHEFIDINSHRLNQTGKWGGHDMSNAYADLWEVDHNPHWLNLIVGYTIYLRANAWETSTGLYSPDWNRLNKNEDHWGELMNNASVARAYWRLAATSGGSPSVYTWIRNRQTQKCLRNYNSQKTDNTNIVQYTLDYNSTSQRWAPIDMNNGYYSLRSYSSNKSMQPFAQHTTNDTEAVIYETMPVFDSQLWSFVDMGQGYYRIDSKLAEKSIWPDNGSLATNAHIVLQDSSTATAQQWEVYGYPLPTPSKPFLAINNGDWMETHTAHVERGETVSMRVESEGNGSWRWEGPNGFTATGNEITIENITLNKTGFYNVIYTNDLDVESMTSFEITMPSGVILFQHCDYDGWAVPFGVGIYTKADIEAAGGVDNDASSIYIAPGYQVQFYNYDNLTGSTLVKNQTSDCLVDDGWNDKITSMVISRDDTAAAHWKFNEQQGLIIYDDSGNNLNGMIIDPAQHIWTQGRDCGGLYLDDGSDYISVTGFKGFEDNQSRTCTAWIQILGQDKPDRSENILYWGTQANGQAWGMRVGNNGTLEVDVWNGYISGSKVIDDGRWHHVAAVLVDDGTPDISEIQLFVDGQLDTDAKASSMQTIVTTPNRDVMLGMRRYEPSYMDPFNGVIDEVKLYDRPLRVDEIAAMYEAHQLPSDLTGDGMVNMNDLASLGNHWQQNSCDGDLTCDCIINMDDMLVLIQDWLEQVE